MFFFGALILKFKSGFQLYSSRKNGKTPPTMYYNPSARAASGHTWRSSSSEQQWPYIPPPHFIIWKNQKRFWWWLKTLPLDFPLRSSSSGWSSLFCDLSFFFFSPSDCDMMNNSKLCAKEWSHWWAHYGCLAGSQYGADGFLFSFFGRAKWMYVCFYFFRNYLKIKKTHSE